MTCCTNQILCQVLHGSMDWTVYCTNRFHFLSYPQSKSNMRFLQKTPLCSTSSKTYHEAKVYLLLSVAVHSNVQSEGTGVRNFLTVFVFTLLLYFFLSFEQPRWRKSQPSRVQLVALKVYVILVAVYFSGLERFSCIVVSAITRLKLCWQHLHVKNEHNAGLSAEKIFLVEKLLKSIFFLRWAVSYHQPHLSLQAFSNNVIFSTQVICDLPIRKMRQIFATLVAFSNREIFLLWLSKTFSISLTEIGTKANQYVENETPLHWNCFKTKTNSKSRTN